MKALILVDIQNDFLPGGALEVKEGDAVVPVANKLSKQFNRVVATQDFHPENHGSFASNHPGKQPGEYIELNGLEQILWPDHCVQNTRGSQFADTLDMEPVERVFVKGTDPEIDSYSGFFDNGHRKATGLGDYLKNKGVNEVYIVGLAADVCVKFTALDAVKLGFTTYLVQDGTRAVNLQPDDFSKALEEMKAAGVKLVNSEDLLD